MLPFFVLMTVKVISLASVRWRQIVLKCFLSELCRVRENLLQTLLKPIDVVVNQVLTMDFILVDQADKC